MHIKRPCIQVVASTWYEPYVTSPPRTSKISQIATIGLGDAGECVDKVVKCLGVDKVVTCKCLAYRKAPLFCHF